MKKKEPTPAELIWLETERIRSIEIKTSGMRSRKSPKDLAKDMIVVAKAFILDLEKYLRTNMQEPARRARRGTKALNTLGSDFRIQSIKDKKYGKN